MKIDAFTIYLWRLADELKSTMGGMSAFLLFPVGGCFIIWIIVSCLAKSRLAAKQEYPALNREMDPVLQEQKYTELATKIFRPMKWLGILATVLGMLGSLLPSSKTIAMMVVIPKIADSKVIQQDLPDIYNAAVEALKAAIKPEPK